MHLRSVWMGVRNDIFDSKIFDFNFKCDTLHQLSLKLNAQDSFALKKVDLSISTELW